MKTKCLLGIAAIALSAPLANAASILSGGMAPVKLLEDENTGVSGFNVSVFNDTLRYASRTGGTPTAVDSTVAETLIDHVFVNSSGTEVSNGASTIISTTGGSAGNKPYTFSVWDVTDPGASFSSTADSVDVSGARYSPASGTIDISALTEGSIYFFYGNNNSSTARGISNVTMSGTGTDQAVLDFGDVTSATTNDGDMFVASFDFTNEGDYDTVTWSSDTFTYFSGVAVTAVPEPSAALFGALGMLALLRRRG